MSPLGVELEIRRRVAALDVDGPVEVQPLGVERLERFARQVRTGLR